MAAYGKQGPEERPGILIVAERRLLVELIFDQLNCSYARYYTRSEAVALLERGGFQDVKAYHRHGMSWTVMGTKPGEARARC